MFVTDFERFVCELNDLYFSGVWYFCSRYVGRSLCKTLHIVYCSVKQVSVSQDQKRNLPGTSPVGSVTSVPVLLKTVDACPQSPKPSLHNWAVLTVANTFCLHSEHQGFLLNCCYPRIAKPCLLFDSVGVYSAAQDLGTPHLGSSIWSFPSLHNR